MELGSLLRHLRGQSELTIGALSRLAEVSPGLISQIERGHGNPSFTTLIKLAHALDTPVGAFFGGTEAAPQSAHVPAGTGRKLLLSEANLVYELLTPSMRGKLGMIKAQIAAGWSNETVPYRHDGEECIFLLEGQLDVNVGGVEYHLRVGDALTYDASEQHWYRNDTAQSAVIVGAMAPPSF